MRAFVWRVGLRKWTRSVPKLWEWQSWFLESEVKPNTLTDNCLNQREQGWSEIVRNNFPFLSDRFWRVGSPFKNDTWEYQTQRAFQAQPSCLSTGPWDVLLTERLSSSDTFTSSCADKICGQFLVNSALRRTRRGVYFLLSWSRTSPSCNTHWIVVIETEWSEKWHLNLYVGYWSDFNRWRFVEICARDNICLEIVFLTRQATSQYNTQLFEDRASWQKI